MLDLDEKINLSLNLNEKQIYMFYLVFEIVYMKEILLIDSYNVEKRLNKIDLGKVYFLLCFFK